MTLSACLISWNEWSTIDLCLESLAGFVDEVVLVDNGSFDGTVEKARRCLKKFNIKGKIIEAESHSLGESRIRAIEESTGDWIILSDSNIVYTSPVKKRFKSLIKEGCQGIMPSLNLIGDYGHYFSLRRMNAHHLTLFKKKHIAWGSTEDRPRLERGHRNVRKTPWAVNLSRVRPAWRCWYRGEPFMKKKWKNRFNTQYQWLRNGGYTSIVDYVQEKQGLSLEDVKQIAPEWYLGTLQKYAKPLSEKTVRLLPEPILKELKNPRYKLIYERERVVGRTSCEELA